MESNLKNTTGLKFFAFAFLIAGVSATVMKSESKLVPAGSSSVERFDFIPISHDLSISHALSESPAADPTAFSTPSPSSSNPDKTTGVLKSKEKITPKICAARGQKLGCTGKTRIFLRNIALERTARQILKCKGNVCLKCVGKLVCRKKKCKTKSCMRKARRYARKQDRKEARKLSRKEARQQAFTMKMFKKLCAYQSAHGL